MKLILVFADRFDNFVAETGTMRYSELIDILRNPPLEKLKGQYLVAGQGLTEMEIDHAYCLGISLGLHQEMQHWRMDHTAKPAGRELTHKHRNENVLVSAPRRLSESEFESDLLVNDDNELMLDHNSGLHVQGMVLTEACRQMFLSVTEKYFVDNFQAAKRYFVINEMNVRFTSFVFPLPAQIRYRVVNLNQSRADRIAVEVEMTVIQNGKDATTMHAKFAVFDGAVLSQKEAQMAKLSLDHYMQAAAAQFKDIVYLENPIQQQLMLESLRQEARAASLNPARRVGAMATVD